MNIAELLSLGFVCLFAGLMLAAAFYWRERPERAVRLIPAFQRLRNAVGLAVEAGKRLHISLGRGDVLSTHSAVAYEGMSVLERIARSTAAGDRPPMATSGDSVVTVLSQETLRGASRYLGADFDPLKGRLAGLTPFSYAAGAVSLIHEEELGASLLIGSFGSEVALIAESGERTNSLSLGGTDNLAGQAVIYAAVQEPLIGEETYSSAAYLGAGGLHSASMIAQDVLRWLIILLLLIGTILKVIGIL